MVKPTVIPTPLVLEEPRTNVLPPANRLVEQRRIAEGGGLEPDRQQSAPSSAVRFNNLNISPQDVFTDKFRATFPKGEILPLSEEVRGGYDKQYNIVRFYIGNYENVVNFYLDGKGAVTTVQDLKNGPDSATLADIAAAGGLKPEFLKRFGITPEAVSAARAKKLERQEILASLETGSLNKLPNSYAYDGSAQNTSTVLQGQGQIITPGGKTNGLYTFAAAPCSILIAVAKDGPGNVTQVGMAHIDANTPLSSINSFLHRTKGNGQNVEAYVISGEENTALRVEQSIKQTGAKLVFANIDRDGQRVDAAVVDDNGNVFYGESMGLANINQKELE